MKKYFFHLADGRVVESDGYDEAHAFIRAGFGVINSDILKVEVIG